MQALTGLGEAAVRLGWSRSVEGSRRDIYEALMRLAAGRGEVEVSITELAVASGRSRPLVFMGVADLELAGLIRKYPPLKDPQRQRASRYELL